MKDLRDLDRYRQQKHEIAHAGVPGNSGNGIFAIRSIIDRKILYVIASNGGGWEHVSVSRDKRCPNWPEMDQIKQLFWCDDEVVVQFHVPPSEHVNFHPYCLHLWMPAMDLPRPPTWMVGPLTEQSQEEAS